MVIESAIGGSIVIALLNVKKLFQKKKAKVIQKISQIKVSQELDKIFYGQLELYFDEVQEQNRILEFTQQQNISQAMAYMF